MKKSLFLLLAGAPLAFGQATVVERLDGTNDEDLPLIGIIPTEDYQKATAEVDRLQRELDAIQKREVKGEKMAVLLTEQKQQVQTLRKQLKEAKQVGADKERTKNSGFVQREKALVERVNLMARERAQATKRLQQRIESLQADVDKTETGWEQKLQKAEEERDLAVEKNAEYLRKWEKARDAWKNSVAKWDQDVERAVRNAQIAEAQKAVANTARLAADWQAERELLVAEVEESELTRAKENEAWKESVDDWRQRAAAAVRASNVKNAQAAVANTAELAKAWQAERNQLEAQVKKMSGALANLEGQLGVRGFEEKQAEVLRLGLVTKSRALEDLGTDASRLARAWKNEREESRRELDAMRDLYKSTAKDVKTRDQRLNQLDAALAEKNQALDELATEAGKLAESWSGQRGGLQKKIADLEQKLAMVQNKLKEAVKKERNAQARVKKTNEEKMGLLSQVKKDQQNDLQVSTKLATQLKLAGDMQEELAMAKLQEGKLKTNFAKLREEVGGLKRSAAEYQSQKEADAQALAALRAELEQELKNHSATKRELASANEVVKKTRAEADTLKKKAQQLEGQLTSARQELAAARKDAEANQKLKTEAAAKAKQVANLEDQLGRLAVAQQELEGTLISTLGDFEKLQKSYINLKAKSADGGDAAKQAIAAKASAEEQLLKLQQKLKAEEINVRKARERVQQVEEKKKAAEADAKAKEEAGKAALGKREAELEEARSEMQKMQLGQKDLIAEREALRTRFVHIEPVRYQLASANVVAQQQRVLAEVRQVLEVYPNAHFSIKGHTCNIGSEDANLKLSEDRAVVLKDFLIKNGVEESRFTLVEGCGDTQPEATNDTDEGRRQNRRVEIEYVE